MKEDDDTKLIIGISLVIILLFVLLGVCYYRNIINKEKENVEAITRSVLLQSFSSYHSSGLLNIDCPQDDNEIQRGNIDEIETEEAEMGGYRIFSWWNKRKSKKRSILSNMDKHTHDNSPKEV